MGWGPAESASSLGGESAKPNKSDERKRANWSPLAEDHGGQADEALAGRHVLIEAAHGTNGEIGAADTGDHAADDDIHVAHEEHIDPERVGGLGMFAHGARAQVPRVYRTAGCAETPPATMVM